MTGPDGLRKSRFPARNFSRDRQGQLILQPCCRAMQIPDVAVEIARSIPANAHILPLSRVAWRLQGLLEPNHKTS